MAALIRALPGEYQRVTSTLIDIDADSGQPGLVAEQILSELCSRQNPGEICYREGHRYESELNPITLSGDNDLEVDASRVYLITGGTRGLGALVAQFLVRRGVRKLALLGRRALPDPGEWAGLPASHPAQTSIAQIRELEKAGTQVLLFTGDRLENWAALSIAPAAGRPDTLPSPEKICRR